MRHNPNWSIVCHRTTTPNDEDSCTVILVALAWLVVICAVAMILCCVLGGCATYTVDQATGGFTFKDW